VTIQVRAPEQYIPVVVFAMLYKVVLTSESVDEMSMDKILKCDHSSHSVLSCGAVYYAVQGSSNF